MSYYYNLFLGNGHYFKYAKLRRPISVELRGNNIHTLSADLFHIQYTYRHNRLHACFTCRTPIAEDFQVSLYSLHQAVSGGTCESITDMTV